MSRVVRLLKILSLVVFVLLAVVMIKDTRIATRAKYFRPPPKVVKGLEYLLSKEQLKIVLSQSKHYIKYYPYSAELIGLSAVANAKLGNYALSESDSDQAILIDPSVSWIYLARGLTRFESLRLERAMKEFSSAKNLGCQSSIFYASKASCEVYLNLFESSWIDSKKALILNPRNSEALIVQAELLLARLQLGQVLANLELVEKIHPQTAYGKTIKLCALSKLGKVDEAKLGARELLKQTDKILMSLETNNSRWNRRDIVLARTARGYAHLYRNQLNAAQSDFGIVLNMMPQFPLAIEGQAQVLMKKCDLSRAMNLLNKLDGEKNNRLSTIFLKAQNFYQQKKMKEALALLKLMKKRGCNQPFAGQLENKILEEIKLPRKSGA